MRSISSSSKDHAIAIKIQSVSQLHCITKSKKFVIDCSIVQLFPARGIGVERKENKDTGKRLTKNNGPLLHTKQNYYHKTINEESHLEDSYACRSLIQTAHRAQRIVGVEHAYLHHRRSCHRPNRRAAPSVSRTRSPTGTRQRRTLSFSESKLTMI
jgi:hypothetical protein